ncbi:MAG: hypothetical protein KDC14_07455 [Planctomycetes bacterium]|nr:hypothetical protein [Planctomycetota bacterium]
MTRITATWLAAAALAATGVASPTSTDQVGPLPCSAPVAHCDPGCYDLGNKVTGVVAPPDYGLRLDGLFGDPASHWTFDFEAPLTGVQMCYDGTGTIVIDGIAYGGLDVGSDWDPIERGFLEIHFVYENATCVNGNLYVLESEDTFAGGSVTWLNTGDVIELTGKANGAGEIFIFDGQGGDPARGWVMYGNNLVGDFAMTVFANTNCFPEPDCDNDGIPDSQEADCNANGLPDDCEGLPDCNQNGVPDECDIAAGAADENQNGVPDVCEPGVEEFCVPDPQVGFTVPCPCGNDVLPGASGGCVNSTGVGAVLQALGTTSIAAADLELVASNLPDHSPGIFITGLLPANGGMGTPFRAGVLCIDGPIVRLEKVQLPQNGQSSMPMDGSLPVWQQVGATPGDTFYFQFWYRDHGGPCASQANLTNALRVTFGV